MGSSLYLGERPQLPPCDTFLLSALTERAKMAERSKIPGSVEELTKVSKLADGVYEADLAPAFSVGTGETPQCPLEHSRG